MTGAEDSRKSPPEPVPAAFAPEAERPVRLFCLFNLLLTHTGPRPGCRFFRERRQGNDEADVSCTPKTSRCSGRLIVGRQLSTDDSRRTRYRFGGRGCLLLFSEPYHGQRKNRTVSFRSCFWMHFGYVRPQSAGTFRSHSSKEHPIGHIPVLPLYSISRPCRNTRRTRGVV